MKLKKWLSNIENEMKKQKQISLIWFCEELNIEIKPHSDNSVIFWEKHATLQFGENQIISMKDAMLLLMTYDKPDMIAIDGKEVK